MYVRCAYLVGDVENGKEAEFDAWIDREVGPAIAALPKVREVRILKARERDDNAPGVYMTLEHLYDSAEDLKTALATPARDVVLEKLKAILPLFDGELLHVNYDVDRRPVAN
ncbi:MAG: hypothetical protein QF654_04725 [Alphaproteobacteria bacterium]|nr:hypothetical protein [Alphaproteobacteria bacterium]